MIFSPFLSKIRKHFDFEILLIARNAKRKVIYGAINGVGKHLQAIIPYQYWVKNCTLHFYSEDIFICIYELYITY